MNSDLERLVAVHEISQLKARYFRAVDTKDWDLLARCFTDDARVDFSAAGADALRESIGPLVANGRDEAVDWIKGAVTGATTVHHGHMPEITVLSSDGARGVWAMADHLWYEPDSETEARAATPYAEIDAVGHYHEEYRKVDGAWHIADLRLTRLRSEESDW